MQNAIAETGHNNPPTQAELIAADLNNRQSALLQSKVKLLESAGRAPTTCGDEKTAEDITTLLKLLATNRKGLESAREAEKEPFLSGGRIVDNFFKGHQAEIDTAVKKAKEPLDTYLKAKVEAERKRLADEAEEKRKQAAAEMEAALELEQKGHAGFAESAMVQASLTEHQANKAQVQSFARPAALGGTRSISASAGLRTRWVGTDIDRDKLDLEKLRQHIPLAALQTALNAFVSAGGREIAGAVIKEQTDTVVR